MKYRKKPVEIYALQWDGSIDLAKVIITWINNTGGTARYHDIEPAKLHDSSCRCDGRGIVPSGYSGMESSACPATEIMGDDKPAFIAIDTLEGTMKASSGDFIIRGVQGEFYPCKPDIFKATYEEVL
jgi:hypothetical protein